MRAMKIMLNKANSFFKRFYYYIKIYEKCFGENGTLDNEQVKDLLFETRNKYGSF